MTRKATFIEGWSWFKFNNLGVAPDMALKLCTSVAVKDKSQEFFGTNSYVCRSCRVKTGRGGLFSSLPSWIGLIAWRVFKKKKKINFISYSCNYNAFQNNHTPRVDYESGSSQVVCLIYNPGQNIWNIME